MQDLLRIPYNLIRPIYEQTSFHRSVIDEVEDKTLQGAYARCRSITREHAKTFYMAARFLPNEKQRGIFAVYGLCRYIDDLVDEAEDLVAKQILDENDIRAYLGSVQAKLVDTYNGTVIYEDPILLAFSDVLRNYRIPLRLPLLLIEGVGSDLIKNRYRTFEEIYDYSYKVASTVGLMTTEIFGYRSEEARRYAVDLGIAMQLTNILRDLGEDLNKNRIYIPRDELDLFGVTEQNLFKHRIDDNFTRLIRFQINRTRQFYRRAENGIRMLTKDSRLPVYLARFNYSRILDKIEENDYDVFNHRAYLNASEKISILPRVLLRLFSER